MPADFIHMKDPTYIISMAVKRMLPKNNSRRVFMDRLKIYGDEHHDFFNEFLIPLEPLDEDASFQETRF